MTENVTLGGRDFEVRPLKLGQLHHLLDALDEMTGKSGGALIEAAAKVVTAGLAPAHPDPPAHAPLDLAATPEGPNPAGAAGPRHPRPAPQRGTPPGAGPARSPPPPP